MFDTTVIAENKWMAYGNPNIQKKWDGSCYFASLLADNDTKCCLGFEAEQCGIPLSRMTRCTQPSCMAHAQYEGKLLNEDLRAIVPHLVDSTGTDTGFSKDAMRINDNKEITYTQKKKALTKLWREQGWKLIFVKTVAEMKRKINEC